MAKFEVEIDDTKGEFVGEVPTALDAILKKIEADSHGKGYGKGSQKAAEEAKAQIAESIKTERMRWEAEQPGQRQKFAEIEERNGLLKGQIDSLEETLRERGRNMTQLSENHALEITKRADALTKRNEKIRSLVVSQLRGLASQHGARDESLQELEVILQHRIGFDDDFEPYVKGEDGQPARTTAGNPLGMDVFVKQYLDNHPHHRKPVAGRGGNAPGGATLRNGNVPTSIDSARSRVEQGDRGLDAIADLFQASRSRAS